METKKIYVIDSFNCGITKAFDSYHKAVVFVFEEYNKNYVAHDSDYFDEIGGSKTADLIMHDIENLFSAGFIEDFAYIISLDLE